MSAELLIEVGLGIGIDNAVLTLGIMVFHHGCHVETRPCIAVQRPTVVSVETADTPAHFGAVNILLGFGDDVDHPGERIGTIHGGTRPAHHLDTGDGLHRHRH